MILHEIALASHYSTRAHYYDVVRRFSGRLCDRAPYDKFGSMLCYGFRDLAIGPVTVMELCCDMAYDMICMMI